MSDNILSAVLTFTLLAGGTAAIGSEMFSTRASTQTPVVTLPTVTIVAHRAAALQVVTLPTVEVIGRRDSATRIAFEGQASEPRRVQ